MAEATERPWWRRWNGMPPSFKRDVSMARAERIAFWPAIIMLVGMVLGLFTKNIAVFSVGAVSGLAFVALLVFAPPWWDRRS